MSNYVTLILKSICSILIGAMLMWKPESMTTVTVQIIGGLFLISGLVPTISYFFPNASNSAIRPFFPVVGIGSVLLGALLVLMPGVFVTALMFMLGGLLFLAALQQILSQISNRRVAPISWLMMLLSTALLALGAFILTQPMASASLPFVLLGAGCIYYGSVELIRGIRLHAYDVRQKKERNEEYVDFEPVNEKKEEEKNPSIEA